MTYKFGSSYLDRHVLRPLCVKIAAVERNWPYRIKKRILDMEPIENTGSAISLVTICRSNDFFDALWSLWSWLYYLRDICAPILVVDGKVDQTNKNLASRVLPEAQVISAEEFAPVLCNVSDDASEFCWRHVFGRKAATIIALQNIGPILFTDPDVLVFDRPVELVEALANLRFPMFSRNHVTYAVDPWMKQRIRACGLEMDPDFNSGIMALPKQTIDLETLKALLEGWRDSPRDHFAEQTLFSGLLISAGGRGLPASRYVARADAMWFWRKEMDYDGVVARHYVGPVRHHLYQKGMPYLSKLRGIEKSGRERSA